MRSWCNRRRLSLGSQAWIFYRCNSVVLGQTLSLFEQAYARKQSHPKLLKLFLHIWYTCETLPVNMI